ncbi:hypothetical protein DYB38_010513 [Aphanomyces astaci]|uniref:Histidine acid phosphatase n=2 Tax=Aphanomyces astaci TaxID=112090 RepID=A0A397CWC0_APHAT|nr:hypothetical protein DYB38_010513 [Aphanomyces astaci]
MATTMVCAELRQVLVVSRHGVRGPYGPEGLPPTEANMQRYSKDKYPFPVKATDWGTSDDATELVSPKITKHGARVIRNMGEVTSSFVDMPSKPRPHRHMPRTVRLDEKAPEFS